MTGVVVKSYTAPELSRSEILRYARAGACTPETERLLDTCLAEAEGTFRYSLCYTELALSVKDNICDFGQFRAESRSLAKNLGGCSHAIVFAATVGLGIDRLTMKYSRLAPSRALMFQAMGAERIEALCDIFEAELREQGKVLRSRFSAGYGDLPIETQRDIFKVLMPEKHIGVSLNENMLMSPTKSVTAFIGIEK